MCGSKASESGTRAAFDLRLIKDVAQASIKGVDLTLVDLTSASISSRSTSRPIIGSALRNSFFEMLPLSSSSHSRKRSITRTAALDSASRICATWQNKSRTSERPHIRAESCALAKARAHRVTPPTALHPTGCVSS